MQFSMQHESICGVIMLFINQIILYFNVCLNAGYYAQYLSDI